MLIDFVAVILASFVATLPAAAADQAEKASSYSPSTEASNDLSDYLETEKQAESFTLLVGEERHFDCLTSSPNDEEKTSAPQYANKDQLSLPSSSLFSDLVGSQAAGTLAWFKLNLPYENLATSSPDSPSGNIRQSSNIRRGGAVRIPDISSALSSSRHILPQTPHESVTPNANTTKDNFLSHVNTFVDNGFLHLQPVTTKTDGIYLCELLTPSATDHGQYKSILLRTIHLSTTQPVVSISPLRVGVTFAVVTWNTTDFSSPHVTHRRRHHHKRASSWLTDRHKITQIAQLNYRLLPLPVQLTSRAHIDRRHTPKNIHHTWQIERQLSGIQINVLHAHERSVTIRDLLPDAEYEICLMYRTQRKDAEIRRLCCVIIHTQQEDSGFVSSSSLMPIAKMSAIARADLFHFLLLLALLLTFVTAASICSYRIVFGLRRYGRQKLKIFPVEDEALLSAYGRSKSYSFGSRYYEAVDGSRRERKKSKRRSKDEARMMTSTYYQDADEDEEFWVIADSGESHKLDSNYRRHHKRRRKLSEPHEGEGQEGCDERAAPRSQKVVAHPRHKVITEHSHLSSSDFRANEIFSQRLSNRNEFQANLPKESIVARI